MLRGLMTEQLIPKMFTPNRSMGGDPCQEFKFPCQFQNLQCQQVLVGGRMSLKEVCGLR